MWATLCCAPNDTNLKVSGGKWDLSQQHGLIRKRKSMLHENINFIFYSKHVQSSPTSRLITSAFRYVHTVLIHVSWWIDDSVSSISTRFRYGNAMQNNLQRRYILWRFFAGFHTWGNDGNKMFYFVFTCFKSPRKRITAAASSILHYYTMKKRVVWQYKCSLILYEAP